MPLALSIVILPAPLSMAVMPAALKAALAENAAFRVLSAVASVALLVSMPRLMVAAPLSDICTSWVWAVLAPAAVRAL